MNPKKSFESGLPQFFLTFICGSLFTAIPAAAQISVVRTGSLDHYSNRANYTLSFDASGGGSPLDKLIVYAGTESFPEVAGITYNGVALTLIPNTGGGTGRNRGIWYLDNPFSGGAADIVVSGDGTNFNHMRLGVASISGSAPGAAIGNIAAAASVPLNVPVNSSFVFAAHASNQITGTPSPGITTVTANVTGTATRNLFVRVNVTQP